MNAQTIIDGWCWEQGPTFYGEDARDWAITWGKVQQYLAGLKSYADLTENRKDTIEAIKRLETV